MKHELKLYYIGILIAIGLLGWWIGSLQADVYKLETDMEAIRKLWETQFKINELIIK